MDENNSKKVTRGADSNQKSDSCKINVKNIPVIDLSDEELPITITRKRGRLGKIKSTVSSNVFHILSSDEETEVLTDTKTDVFENKKVLYDDDGRSITFSRAIKKTRSSSSKTHAFKLIDEDTDEEFLDTKSTIKTANTKNVTNDCSGEQYMSIDETGPSALSIGKNQKLGSLSKTHAFKVIDEDTDEDFLNYNFHIGGDDNKNVINKDTDEEDGISLTDLEDSTDEDTYDEGDDLKDFIDDEDAPEISTDDHSTHDEASDDDH